MMPEHDPRPARGSAPDADEADAPPSRARNDDGVVRLPSRLPPDQDTVVEDAAELTVVDLRPRPDDEQEASAGSSPERRSPEVAAATVPTPPAELPLSEPTPPPRSMLSHRVLRVVAPALVVLLMAMVSAGLAVGRSADLHRSADDWEAAAAAASARTAGLAELWAGVVGTVAAGVGQPLQVVDRVPQLLGDAGAETGLRLPTDAAERDVDAATRDRQSFLDDVDAALDRSEGSPVELGNELDALDASRRDAVASSDALAERLTELARADRSAANDAATLAVLVSVVGLIGALVAAEVSRRRLRSGLDRPLSDLHVAVAQVGADHVETPAEVRGFPELAWLGAELRRRATEDRQRLAQVRRRAEWGDQSRRIFEALELAEDEPASYEVLARALAVIGGTRPVELLLAERGSTALHPVAVNPQAPAPGCPVDLTGACVALRRGQVAVFDSSESINACPKLRDRPSGPCAAACVPVTVAGRPVGVVHMTAPDGAPPEPEIVEQLVGLATQTGTRFSALRTLESSRQEASTDGLTGLPNRRTLETRIGELFERDMPFVLVLADLDRFKLLNDNYGHEVGDKALQLFAGVLRDNVRGNDVVARLGGEEFVLVYPGMSVEISLEAVDRVRAALARALDATTLPGFTCSFGIAHSTVGSDGDAVLRVADAGLLQAKDLGGDQAVVADAELAVTIFDEDAPLRSRRDSRG